MALLDVSEILADPDLNSLFVVKRRSEVIGNNGRASMDEQTLSGPDVSGVVCAASPNDLKRLDDSERTERTLSIVTQFRLRASAPGYQPDLIGFEGNFYIVKNIQPYTQYGAGFIQALAGLYQFQAMPPQGSPPNETTSDVAEEP